VTIRRRLHAGLHYAVADKLMGERLLNWGINQLLSAVSARTRAISRSRPKLAARVKVASRVSSIS